MLSDKTDQTAPTYILGSQYFLYFGVMGSILPYFNLYCYHIGFNGVQIGVLSALRTGSAVLFPLLWGLLADRLDARKPIYILCNFLSAAVWILYLYTTDYKLMIFITIGYGVFYSPIIAFLEAFTMDLLGKKKKTYGRIRAWGTISFIVTASLLGKAIDLLFIEIILILVLAQSLIQAFLSIKIPNSKRTKESASRSKTNDFLNMRVAVFLFCAFLMLVSHGAYYGFFSIHLEKLGYGNTFIGIAWAMASVSEILVMINSGAIFKRYRLETVLSFSFAIALLRWVTLFFVTTPAAILFSQVFHAVTYGTFHMASILYIDRLVSDTSKTLGQAVNNAVTYGLGMMVGIFLSGYYFEKAGSSLLFLISGAIAAAGGLLFWAFWQFSQMRGISHEE